MMSENRENMFKNDTGCWVGCERTQRERERERERESETAYGEEK